MTPMWMNGIFREKNGIWLSNWERTKTETFMELVSLFLGEQPHDVCLGMENFRELAVLMELPGIQRGWLKLPKLGSITAIYCHFDWFAHEKIVALVGDAIRYNDLCFTKFQKVDWTCLKGSFWLWFTGSFFWAGRKARSTEANTHWPKMCILSPLKLDKCQAYQIEPSASHQIFHMLQMF